MIRGRSSEKWYSVRILGIFLLTANALTIGVAQVASAANPTLSKAIWNASQSSIQVAGRNWGKGQPVTVSNAATGEVLGTVQANNMGAWTLTVSNPAIVPCRVWAESAQGFAQKNLDKAPSICSNAPGALVFSFNNLGMHCYDSDYSVFSILPPFNTVLAQVVRRGAGGNKPEILDPTQAEVFYWGVPDKKGSINTTSENKTNFWDYVLPLFGAALPVDEGLTGNKMPGSGNMPQAFKEFDPGTKWFTASGIPITNWDKKKKRNTYPLMQIQPFDISTVAVPPTTHVVLPVSDEMHCSDCHATGGVAANDATKARYGINNWSYSTDPQIQYRENILILHDGKHATPLMASKPVLCASCHYSPALDLSGTGPNPNQAGKPMLSYATHGRHGKTLDGNIPTPSNPAVIPDTGIATCYNCHPGNVTKCLRGVMSSAGIFCQSCHGDLLAVGGVYSARTPWIDEPKCQSCHAGDALDHAGNRIQLHIAYDPADPAATPRVATNKRFAEGDGKLYRDSLGHGGMACEACHGSTHAEWPVANSNANDNVAANQLQGHAGPIIECNTCHADGLALTASGPHGLHNVNSQDWNLNHKIFYELDLASCQACHGVNLEGTPLARAAATRKLLADDDRKKTIKKGTQISCTLCHENPLRD